MGKFRIEITKNADRDIKKQYKSGNKISVYKIKTIIKELSEHPYSGTGKPERLKGNLSNLWSRHINKKDRLVYKVQENIVTVYILSAIGHYEDK